MIKCYKICCANHGARVEWKRDNELLFATTSVFEDFYSSGDTTILPLQKGNYFSFSTTSIGTESLSVYMYIPECKELLERL